MPITQDRLFVLLNVEQAPDWFVRMFDDARSSLTNGVPFPNVMQMMWNEIRYGSSDEDATLMAAYHAENAKRGIGPGGIPLDANLCE